MLPQFFSQDQENEIGLMAFRLLTKDLLDLYAAMNQAVMNVLSRRNKWLDKHSLLICDRLLL